MARPKIPRDEFVSAVTAMRQDGLTEYAIAKRLGYVPDGLTNYRKRCETAGIALAQLEVGPDPLPPVEDLLAERKRKFEHKRRHHEAAKLTQVRVRTGGPIGILFFGDPHVDDDGTDIGLLEYHTSLVRNTPGLFAANVGDTTNNWVGRLARLYGEQSTSAAEAWKLCEWFVGSCDWLFMIGGNHDLWSGAGDPLKWIAAQHGAIYRPSEVRIELNFPGSKRTAVVNARHDFPGHSMWNPAHGVGRAAQMGCRDDILVCGHRHVSGYMPIKDPTSYRISHCLQVASYKVYDRYAMEKGFRDQNISPAVLAVIDPSATRETGFIQPFFDIDNGVDFLNFLRRRAA